MQLVIDIPDKIYDTIQNDEFINREQLSVLQMHILNGTPLDKIIDKIRTEIAELTKCPYGTECLGANCPSNTDCMLCGDHVLEIIDKYKAEREEV